MKRASSTRFLYAAFLFLLSACQAVSLPAGPGDTIAGMGLTTGAQDAPPLRSFCNPTLESDNVLAFECELPRLSKLAIGDPAYPGGERLDNIDWSASSWEFSIDDRPLALEAFGTFRIVRPVMPWKPSALREAFEEFTAWDIVLTNLAPGEHSIHAAVQTEADRYIWDFHIVIKR